MDKVTHFLLLVALVLFIVTALIWLIGGSCVAGFVAKHHQLPPWLQYYYNGSAEDASQAANLVKKNIPRIVDTVGKEYQEIKSDISDIADAAKQYVGDKFDKLI